ncbi:NADH:flavin oxidoreductase/NADH oxidase [Pseudonocardia spinosispora]|uniref:NADH:flavin oxidoreductase/NADH oxidase n=1 Tax=Pseudonocardia spinosispora TaxID=103441 RepID=UPI000424D1C9|nr:NADH:flavin oxidoreductase/NADH oxidase [Pseudonocardia spinosispora]
MTSIFEPVTVRGTRVRNRAWLAPLCQYSVDARDGVPTDWHLVHLGARATGGFGLVMTEATAVTPEGRITPHDTGLWNDAQATAWERITGFLASQGAIPAVQLAHAGRKASTTRPWRGGVPVDPDAGGWTPLAPSPSPYPGLTSPIAMTQAAIDATVRAFAAAASRAVDAGFEVVEVHAAHGYLLHEFLSPLSNGRTDSYGGSFRNRARLLIEVVDAVRAAIPDIRPLFVRLSATDWVDGGWTLDDTVALSALLADHGVDLVDLSSGGNDPGQRIPVGPGYQVPFARAVRAETGLRTAAVGLITEPSQAQAILDEGAADAVLLGRAALREPTWPVRAAHELGLPVPDAPYPVQYLRGAYRS